MAKKASEPGAGQAVSQEMIARRAYEIWQAEGCPEGRAMEHWYRAVSELKAQGPGADQRDGEKQAEQGTTTPARRSTARAAGKRFQIAGQ